MTGYRTTLETEKSYILQQWDQILIPADSGVIHAHAYD